jgi:hypothetical protein
MRPGELRRTVSVWPTRLARGVARQLPAIATIVGGVVLALLG